MRLVQYKSGEDQLIIKNIYPSMRALPLRGRAWQSRLLRSKKQETASHRF